MKNKSLITVLLVLGLIFGILGFILSLLPLGTIDLIPSLLAIFIGVLVYLLTKKTKIRRKLVITVIIVSAMALLISLFTEIFFTNKIAEDEKFEERIEQSEEESVEELEEALEDLEDIEDLE